MTLSLFFCAIVATDLVKGLGIDSAFAEEKKMGEFKQSDAPVTGETIAVIKTTAGVMKARIFADVVADSAKNFIELAKQGKYSGVIFHRVIPGFMIQGGDFTNKDGTGGHAYKGAGTTIGDQYDPRLSPGIARERVAARRRPRRPSPIAFMADRSAPTAAPGPAVTDDEPRLERWLG